MEHRTREHFLCKNERVYSPHYDVEALVELCKANRFDERDAGTRTTDNSDPDLGYADTHKL